jgi:hypothetical protein|tara:strand:- start:480 stop:587 length:108 start_codon:yes stop_codon:yes gene_type:complete
MMTFAESHEATELVLSMHKTAAKAVEEMDLESTTG